MDDEITRLTMDDDFYERKTIQVITDGDIRSPVVTVRKDQITHIVRDRAVDHRARLGEGHVRAGKESANLYDFYIHFTSGYVLLVNGLLTKLDIEDVEEWLNT